MSALTCPTCGGPYDPEALLAGMLALEAEFVAAYPRINCPACHKRCSPLGDSVDASFDRPTVQMHCGHCGNRFELERVKS